MLNGAGARLLAAGCTLLAAPSCRLAAVTATAVGPLRQLMGAIAEQHPYAAAQSALQHHVAFTWRGFAAGPGPSGPGTQEQPAAAAGPSPEQPQTATQEAEAPQPAADLAAPLTPSSRKDKGAAADAVYPSSFDDNLGVQKNWFNAIFSQLNVVHKTGLAPSMKGRQKEIFGAVEREFEGLWERHIRDKGLTGAAHRGMLLCCLAIATHKVLRYESGDDALVQEVVRTNLGGLAVSAMMRLHKFRLWLLLRLLAEDPYAEAVRFLPSLQNDMGAMVVSEVEVGKESATWKTTACRFYEVLAAEECPELLPEFCCQYSMQWLEAFGQYGLRVGLERSFAYEDGCCLVRISRPPPKQQQQAVQEERPAQAEQQHASPKQ